MSKKMHPSKINFNYQDVLPFIKKELLPGHTDLLNEAYQKVVQKNGKGRDFLGWTDLPEDISLTLLSEIKKCAATLSSLSEITVVIGIGGSYLGARAVIEMLDNYFPEYEKGKKNRILYAGNHLSEDYLHSLLSILDQKEYSLIVISKSGTTTEPAIAFRILKEHCKKKYGNKESSKRIVAITDHSKGALKKIADENGYTSFIIPDDVGGRYSVLSPVGLLPIAVAGYNIDNIISGASNMRKCTIDNGDFNTNIALQYALLRFLLYQNGKKIELMVAYEPRLFYFIEWFKQLFGESEGKEHKGIFPAGAIFTTDLHSLGQYVQEGERTLFETVISIKENNFRVPIPHDKDNTDALNYLTGKTIQEINLIAEKGTCMAHVSGGVPNMQIILEKLDEETIGELIYFFEFSCAVSGYLLNINPFDQPGVEAYKKNMFQLLGKK